MVLACRTTPCLSVAELKTVHVPERNQRNSPSAKQGIWGAISTEKPRKANCQIAQ